MSGVQPAVQRGILHAVAYADVFDYPLTGPEVHRYLVGAPASGAEVRAALRALIPLRLVYRDGYFTLPGREALVEVRRRRAAHAARLWPHAIRYGRRLAGLPFVRMVAVTGSLAMDNTESASDIDFLIVTEPSKVWLCRAMAGLVDRTARRRGVQLCPNYVLSERALGIQRRDAYTAHELAQMVPVAGLAIYRRLRRTNAWTRRFLPNARGLPRRIEVAGSAKGRVARLAELALRTPVGGVAERLEKARKTRRMVRSAESLAEVVLSADRFQGHLRPNGERVLRAFAERLRALESSEA